MAPAKNPPTILAAYVLVEVANGANHHSTTFNGTIEYMGNRHGVSRCAVAGDDEVAMANGVVGRTPAGIAEVPHVKEVDNLVLTAEALPHGALIVHLVFRFNRPTRPEEGAIALIDGVAVHLQQLTQGEPISGQ
jgi:hypothetical protein